MIKAFIFDLDGVITETSNQHFQAWKAVSKLIGIDIDLKLNEKLKGVSRDESLKEILRHGDMLDKYSPEEREKISFSKNEYYKILISQFTRSNVFEGVIEIFQELKKRNIKIGIASASRNAAGLIKAMELESYVDYIADPDEVENGKPFPDIFLKVASELGVTPDECVGIEDAVAGVTAIKSAGMYAVGIGDQNVLKQADIVYRETKDMDLQMLLEI